MALFDLHSPWVFTIGILGNIVSIFVYFAPLPTFIRIYKSKSTLEFQSVPYVVALFSAMLWMYYALLKTDATLLISVNSIGCVIETIYVVIYLVYASKEPWKHTMKLLVSLNLVLFSLIFVATFFLLHGVIRVQVIGWICVVVSVTVFAAPLSIVFQVVRTQSVEFMPFTLSFFLTLSAVMWFGYGLLQRDWCVALPNVLGFFLGVIQMVLYGVYRNGKKKKKVAVIMEKKLAEQQLHVVKLGGASEVYPVDYQTSSGSDEEQEVECTIATAVDIDDIEMSSSSSHENMILGEVSVSGAPPVATSTDHEPSNFQMMQQLDSPAASAVIIMCAA